LNVAQKAFKGGLWTGLARCSTIGLQIVQYSFLARLLSPSEIGLISLLMTVYFFGISSINSGFGNGIIALGTVSRKQNSSLFWMNLVVGLFTWVVIFAFAPLICVMFNANNLLGPLKIFTAIFLLVPWGQQFEYLLQKELDFKIVSLVDISAVFLEVATCILLATNGAGVYSFVYGKIAYFSLRSMVFFCIGLRNWRPKFYFSITDIRPFINFGLFQLGANYMFVLYSEMPKFIIAPLLGLEAMGTYELATRITMQPLSKIAPVLKKVAFPVIASIQDNIAQVRKAYGAYILLLEVTVAPVSMIIGVFAEPIVTLLFGEEWLHVVPLVRILSVAVFVRSLCQAAASLALGMRRADLDFFQVSCAFVAALVTIYPAAKNWGDMGVACAVLLNSAITLLTSYYLAVKPLVGSDPSIKTLNDYSSILLLIIAVGCSFWFNGTIAMIFISGTSMVIYCCFRYKRILKLKKQILR